MDVRGFCPAASRLHCIRTTLSSFVHASRRTKLFRHKVEGSHNQTPSLAGSHVRNAESVFHETKRNNTHPSVQTPRFHLSPPNQPSCLSCECDPPDRTTGASLLQCPTLEACKSSPEGPKAKRSRPHSQDMPLSLNGTRSNAPALQATT